MQEPKIDIYSHALGVCEAFCEVVRAGVKRIALSHPFTEEELYRDLNGEAFFAACEKIAEKYECKAYHLKEPVLTDLFPISLNIGKQNIVFYRDDRDIEELLSIQRDKNELQKTGKYIGPDRYAIAIRYAHLLSYDDDAITRYLKNNHERE